MIYELNPFLLNFIRLLPFYIFIFYDKPRISNPTCEKISTVVPLEIHLSDFFDIISIEWIKELIEGKEELVLLFYEDIDLRQFKISDFRIGKTNLYCCSFDFFIFINSLK